MRAKLKDLYIQQCYIPKWYSFFINEFYIARSNLAKGIESFSENINGDLLDIGCGIKPYEKLFSVKSYIGLEIDNKQSRARDVADCYYDGSKFPFPDNSFDAVLCSQVLEHVFNPSQFLSEVYRVTRPKGKVLITVPFVWDEHEQPYDYARYSSFGLRYLLESNGFLVLRQEKLGADASILFQLLNAYLYKTSFRWPKFAYSILVMTVMAVVNIVGVVAAKLLPCNPDLYLDQIILAEKVHE